jgi:hypothetical protein
MVMVYNWGDVTEDSYSCLGDPAARQYMLCAEDIKHYLLLSSTDCYTVKMLIRGHQHQLQHLTHGWDTIAITLTIGAEGDYAQQSLGGKPDVAYIIQLALQVDDWMKKRMLRYQRAPEAAVDPMFSPLDDVT